MKLLTVGFLFLFYSSFAQTDSTIYIKEFGWTIRVPSDFKIEDTEPNNAPKTSGGKTAHDSTGHSAKKPIETELITARKDVRNYFTTSYNNTNRFTAENWERKDDTLRKFLYATLQKQTEIVPEIADSIVGIDGVKFKKSEGIFKNPGISLAIGYMTTFYRQHYLVITYMYTDSLYGKEIINLLNKSKFDK